MTDDQLSLLDLPAARTARDEGITRVDGNADDEWKSAVDHAISIFARSGKRFTSDDIRATVSIGEPHHHNAWGGRFIAARKAGLIEKVGHRESARPAGHARTVAVWRGVGT